MGFHVWVFDCGLWIPGGVVLGLIGLLCFVGCLEVYCYML